MQNMRIVEEFHGKIFKTSENKKTFYPSSDPKETLTLRPELRVRVRVNLGLLQESKIFLP